MKMLQDIMKAFSRRAPEPEPSVAFEQQQRAFRAQSVAQPSRPLGWLDSGADGATCGKPQKAERTEEELRAAEERQRQIVDFYRNSRCSSK